VLVTAAAFSGVSEAHIANGRLQAEGIFGTVVHPHHIWVFWPYELALGGVKLQVSHEDAQQARAVLEQCRLGHYRRMLEAELGQPDDLRCPHCDSTRFVSRRSYPEVALLLICFLLTSVTIFPLRSCVHRCDVCGGKWNDNVRRLFLLPRLAP
jgi:hypothetical protein